MELVNELYAVERAHVAAGGSPAKAIPCLCWREVQRTLALLLAPFAPYLAHELWEMLGEKGSLLRAPWPKYDPALAKEDEIEIPVQINGKLRSRIVVPADAPENVVRARALVGRKNQRDDRRQADCESDCGAGQAGQYRAALSSEKKIVRTGPTRPPFPKKNKEGQFPASAIFCTFLGARLGIHRLWCDLRGAEIAMN